MKLILLGPPGSGKDTQAEFVQKSLNLPVIGVGNILREYAQQDTKLGKKIKSIIETGNLIPDDLVNEIVKHRLSQKDCQAGYILDGYPRDVHQAEFLDTIQKIDKVIYISVRDETIINRISNRRVCSKCGESYNLITNSPPSLDTCKCGAKLEHRDDDQPEVVKNRLQVYHKSTEPLIEFYRKKRLLVEIDGEPKIEKVRNSIKKILFK